MDAVFCGNGLLQGETGTMLCSVVLSHKVFK